ncbi:MAG TPA: M23 family metallopeptidase [Frankiaceae bacterium]|nr:M23 family metallopeptidase [Frankiaceae bacterium]
MTSLAALLALAWVLVSPWASARAAGWVAPLDGPLVVRRAFDPPSARWGSGHRGVDLASAPGAPVRAAGAGTVTYAGVLAGRGVLVVTHGTLRTTYEPVSPTADVGDMVRAGAVVASLDAGHAGPAAPGEALLHWGLLRGETYLDPLSLLGRGPSRLVPVSPVPAAPGGAVRPPPGVPLPLPAPRGGSPPLPVGTATLAAAGVAGVALAARRSRASP